MEYGESRRHVSFNLNKPDERAMLQFSKRINFSGWVKQQLAREMRKQQKPSEITIDTSKLGGGTNV